MKYLSNSVHLEALSFTQFNKILTIWLPLFKNQEPFKLKPGMVPFFLPTLLAKDKTSQTALQEVFCSVCKQTKENK